MQSPTPETSVSLDAVLSAAPPLSSSEQPIMNLPLKESIETPVPTEELSSAPQLSVSRRLSSSSEAESSEASLDSAAKAVYPDLSTQSPVPEDLGLGVLKLKDTARTDEENALTAVQAPRSTLR